MTARVANIVLGVWLFVSAFAWPHSAPQLTNTWVLGVMCVAFSLVALAIPDARHLNTALAVWLFLSVWMLPTTNAATVWNNALVAVAIFAVSLVPSERVSSQRRPIRGLP